MQSAPASSLQQNVGLFGLGESGPSEESPTAGMPKPSDDQSTEAPKAFKGQGENDTEQRNELTDTSPSAATQVCTEIPSEHCPSDKEPSLVV